MICLIFMIWWSVDLLCDVCDVGVLGGVDFGVNGGGGEDGLDVECLLVRSPLRSL